MAMPLREPPTKRQRTGAASADALFAAAPPSPIPLLTVVKVVLRECTGSDAVALPHIAIALDAYLDTSAHWSLLRACRANLFSLLLRVARRRDRALEPTRHVFYYVWHSSQCIVAAVRHKNLAMVTWLYDHFPPILPYAALTAAAETGALEIVTWLVTRNPNTQWCEYMINAAAEHGHVDVVAWLHNYPGSTGCTDETFDCALLGGRLNVIQWLEQHCPKVTTKLREDVLEYAMRNGHTHVIKYMLERRPSRSLSTFAAVAAERGDVEFLKWVVERAGRVRFVRARHECISRCNTYALDNSGFSSAAKIGDLELLQWIRARLPYEDAKRAISNAAEYGHLHVLKWLYANRIGICAGKEKSGARQGSSLNGGERVHKDCCPMYSCGAMWRAARSGHLDVVKWLHANIEGGCTTSAMDEAASNGHFEIVQWLYPRRTKGRSMRAVSEAAGGGHLEIVQWFHTNHSKGFSAFTMDCAARSGHLGIVQWLHANRSEGCTTSAMDGAARMGHLAVVQWLHANRSEGCTTSAMDGAAANGHLDIVQWLHANRWEGCTTGAMDGAAANGHLDIVKWLSRKRWEGCTGDAHAGAARHGHADVLLFLDTRYGNRTFSMFVFSDPMKFIEHMELAAWIVAKDSPTAIDIPNMRRSSYFYNGSRRTNYAAKVLDRVLNLPMTMYRAAAAVAAIYGL